MLKALLLRSKLDKKNKELKTLLAQGEDLQKREAELEQAIAESAEATEEEQKVVEEEVDKFNGEKDAYDAAKKKLEDEIAGLENDLKETEAEQEAEPEEPEKPAEEAPKQERKVEHTMNKRFFNMSNQERDAFFAREDVKNYISEVRSAIREKRAINNASLTIPEVFLGIIRENITEYSKLYKHVRVRPVGGIARQVIQGTIPEAVWEECCANLNELDLGFYDAEMDCYKVGGFFDICNATLEDSDEDLAAILLAAIGQAIGLALDKAILYGRNTDANSKMPLGVVSRLAQTSQPAGYPATARPWVDLHTTNILTIADTVTGVDLFKTILTDSAVIKGKYSRGEKVWVMNETTYTFLKAQALSINAAGAIVSGVEGTMPVVGGIVEVLDFLPNYVIIGGFFDLYTLAERAGAKFASSEHVKFLQDRTVFKGTARYDGQPIIAEGFAVIGVNGVTPNATMTFAADNANTVNGILLDKSAATVKATKTVALKATLFPANVDGEITWASSDTTKATVSGGVVTGVAAGSAVITATCGDAVAVCNVTVTN
jgi:HK97 family phage major capsid protein